MMLEFPESFTSALASFTLGTGTSIYTRRLIDAILATREEVILVTCFWAPSATLSALSQAFAQLAKHRKQQHLQPTLRVRICLSSRSLLQKLFHTSSPDGYVYPPESWESKLGLPAPEVWADGNMELTVKSLFFLPFSVMHPKYLIIDRLQAFVPSCNVSWESWLEGCLEIHSAHGSGVTAPGRGPNPIDGLLEFYRDTWDRSVLDVSSSKMRERCVAALKAEATEEATEQAREEAEEEAQEQAGEGEAVVLVWLPSSHHRNPNFRPFPWQSAPQAPPTPLNVATQLLFDSAKQDIYIQTPNLTSPPVLDAIIDALGRGVNVTIVTSRNMMLLEQLLTAGTTTAWCIQRLMKRYKQLSENQANKLVATVEPDLEAQGSDTNVPGALKISYFCPGDTSGPYLDSRLRADIKYVHEAPVQSHVKLSIFDGEYTVLGSGNMDRASWYTSQELGVLVHSEPFAGMVRGVADEVLGDGRLSPVFG